MIWCATNSWKKFNKNYLTVQPLEKLNQKLNVFYGRGDAYEVSGFTFGIKNKEELFQVFDDFEKIESPYPGIEFYSSYFNNLIIRGNSALLIRVEPTMEKVDEVTDSIWYARGNEDPWSMYDYEEESEADSAYQEILEEEIFEEMEEEDKPVSNYDFPDAEEDPNQKN
ncbi:MAG: hypothetical protein RL265_258, partial [Bacteroidota bacterium]